MSLPSQSTRTSARRSSVFRSRRQGGSSRLAFLVALVIMLGLWILMRPESQGQSLAAEPESEQPPAQPSPAPSSAPGRVPSGEPEAAVQGDWLQGVQLPGDPRAESAPPQVARPVAPDGEASVLDGSPSRGTERVRLGFDQLAAGQFLQGRRTLSQALLEGGLGSAEAQRLRAELTALGTRYLLGPESLPGDPFCSTYEISSGDLLSRLPARQDLDVDWRFLQRINGIQDPARIRLGQKLKLVHGAFHALVHKSEYRLDLFLGEPGERILVASFPVGHGEENSTPEGLYQVRKDSKLINPAWTNPRTQERVSADDPENPIGEHWIGLEGVSDAVRAVQSLGIHGTTELDSIGEMRSMGCVRMRAEDVALMYEVLVRPASSIEIRP